MPDETKSSAAARLLIVEDDHAQLRTLSDIMTAEGFDVAGCRTASAAFENLRTGDFPVAILDLRLEDMDQAELLGRLAAYSDRVKFVVNTAYSSFESARDALNIGAFAYVEKAGDPNELVSHVHRAFSAHLRGYADKLRRAVAERTRELQALNDSLMNEIAERKKAEQQLLAKRRQLAALASELTLAQERERRRIALGMHDSVSQKLALVKLELQALARSQANPAWRASLEKTTNVLEGLMEQVRSLTFELSNSALYDLSLEAAIDQWLTEVIQAEHRIKCVFRDDEQAKELDFDVKVLLFRNVRELLMNVVKHAQASNVEVSMSRLGDTLHVVVADDGVGFDVGQAMSGAGKARTFGLLSVREMLEQVGGRFEISSARGRGCTATMTVPLASAKT